jgi:hypothetical protein
MRCSNHITPRRLHSMRLFVTPAVQFLHREPPCHCRIPSPISRSVSRYCICLAASDAARFSFGFDAISTTLLCAPGEAVLFRGAQGCEVRLLKNVTVLHLAALHGADQVSSWCRSSKSVGARVNLCVCPKAVIINQSDLHSRIQVVCMLMKQGEFLGLDLRAVCVASVGKKQFKMTALDVAGDDRSNCFVVFVYVFLFCYFLHWDV